jgi:hypothetical protein
MCLRGIDPIEVIVAVHPGELGEHEPGEAVDALADPGEQFVDLLRTPDSDKEQRCGLTAR